MESGSGSASLRERQKQRRRELIAETALELFDRKGFRSVTVAEIAAEAEVSPRTVSTYFPSKEDLVFPERERWLQSLRQRMAARESSVGALEAMRGWVEDSLEEWVAREDELRVRRRLIETDPRLQARDRAVMAEMAEILRREVARDLGVPEEDMVPRMASAATIAVLDAVDEHFAQVAEASLQDSISDIERRVRQAIRFVEAGIRAA